jgi:hypothetical protein
VVVDFLQKVERVVCSNVLSPRSMDVVFERIDFGFIASDVVDLLKRVQSVMHMNFVSPMSMDIVFKRIEYIIQKGDKFCV